MALKSDDILQLPLINILQTLKNFIMQIIVLIYNSDLFWNHVVECSMESFMHKDYRS